MTLAALDIETDTSPLTDEEKAAGYTARGLDPRITRITSIAIATDRGTTVCSNAPEESILARTFHLLRTIDPALLVTWNGAVFDMPFIHDRALRYPSLRGRLSALKMTPNPEIVPKYDPTPGHEGGYTVTWGRTPHLDMAYIAKADAEARGVKWSLKPYAQALGFEPIEVDRAKMHELTEQEERDYVASDAIVTREIAKRVLGYH